MRLLVRLLALSLACVACNQPLPAALSAAVASPAARGSFATQPASVLLPRPTAVPSLPETPPSLADDLKGLAASNNAFGLELFTKLRAGRGNLAISPLSLSTALTMTWAGTRGETAAQMKKVLHLDGPTEQVLRLTGKLVSAYQDPELKVTLRLVNRLFGENTYRFRQAYVDSIGAAFGAPLEPVDFGHAPEASRQHINAWIAEATEDRIKDLIPQGAVDGTTHLALVNAIYFLGEWRWPFLKQNTTVIAFHPSASESKDVPTMHTGGDFHFAATDGVKLLELPYQGGALAMTLVLPDEVDGLDAVEARLSTPTFDAWIAALAPERLDLSLPKFEINAAASLSLGGTLSTLGMPLAFDQAKADLTGMATGRLYLSNVFHKAFVKVDERGTEAAAASAVLTAGKKRPPPPPKLEFHADHPFLFFLRDLRSGLVLFMGRVSDPTAK